MRKNIITALIMSLILSAGAMPAFAQNEEWPHMRFNGEREKTFSATPLEAIKSSGGEGEVEWPESWPADDAEEWEDWPAQWPEIWYQEEGIAGILNYAGNDYVWHESWDDDVTIRLIGDQFKESEKVYTLKTIEKVLALSQVIAKPGQFELEYTYLGGRSGTRTITIEEGLSEGEDIPTEGEDLPAEGEDTPEEGEGPIIEGEAIPVEGEPVVIEGEEPVIEGETVPVEGEPVVIEGEEPVVEGETVPVEGEPIVIEGEDPVIEGETIPVEGEPVVIEGETVDEDDGGCKGCSSGKAATGAPLEKLQKGLADWLLVSLSGLVLVVLSYGRRK